MRLQRKQSCGLQAGVLWMRVEGCGCSAPYLAVCEVSVRVCVCAWTFTCQRLAELVFVCVSMSVCTSNVAYAFAWCLQEPQRRQNLWERMQQLGGLLGVAVQSPIIPLVVGDEAAALSATALLLRKGFHVPAIRPPTVPNHTSRYALSSESCLDMHKLVEDIHLLLHLVIWPGTMLIASIMERRMSSIGFAASKAAHMLPWT